MKKNNEDIFTERRKYLRFNAGAKVNVQTKSKGVKKGSSSKIAAITRNLSVEGICFESKKKFVHGADIKLEITLPSYKKPLHLEGKVIWSHALRKKSKKNMYDTGVKLFTVEKGDESRFIGYVCDKMMIRLGRYSHI